MDDDYAEKQRERDQLLREADERVERMEAKARDRVEGARHRAIKDVSERARMVAEKEKKRVEEGYYDPHRLKGVTEDRKRRKAIEDDKRAAARAEADSIARYIAAQDARDDARRMQEERNERLRRERMQRLIEMETDEEIERMAMKDREDQLKWQADRWRRNARWVWRTLTSKWSAYAVALVFVTLFVMASIEVDAPSHRPVTRQYPEYEHQTSTAPLAEDGGGADGVEAVSEGASGSGTDAATAGVGGTTEQGPGPWRSKYKWVSPQRAAGKLIPTFISSGASNLYKSINAKKTNRHDMVGNYVHGIDISEMETLGVDVETREGEAYLDHALEEHLKVDDPKEVSLHQKLLMNLIKRGQPLSPPPRPPPPPPPSPPYPPSPGDDPNIKATLKYLRGTHEKPLDVKDEPSSDQVKAPVVQGMTALMSAHAAFKEGQEAPDDVGDGTAAANEEESEFALNDGTHPDTGKSLELLYNNGTDPEEAVVTFEPDPIDPEEIARQEAEAAKEAERKAREKFEKEERYAEMAKTQADQQELQAAVVGALAEKSRSSGGVPTRNGGGVKFNVKGRGDAARAGAMELAVARTPYVLAGEANAAGQKKKKKKRGR